MFTDILKFNAPSIRELQVMLLYSSAFFIFFYTFYGLASILVEDTAYRYHVAFEWEKNIPFIPQAAWIYNSLTLLLFVSLFIIREKARLHLLFKILCVQVVISCILFLIFPIVKIFPSHYIYGELPWIFLLADTVNLENNDFPSLHVCLAFTVVMISTQYLRTVPTVILYLWAIVIAISTILIHEHHIADIFGGILLAIIGARYFAKEILKLRV
jgi:membrane-associated phospholipid phosphatase